MLVGMTGDVEEEASAEADVDGAAFAAFLGFGAAAAASALAFAAASFVPKSSVKTVSRDVFTSEGFAHLLISCEGRPRKD